MILGGSLGFCAPFFLTIAPKGWKEVGCRKPLGVTMGSRPAGLTDLERGARAKAGIAASETTPSRVPEVPPPFTTRVVPARDIRIDGKLDEWPAEANAHAISTQLMTDEKYSTTTTADPGSSTYRVAFDQEAGFLYVAVSVVDSDHVTVSKDPFSTDAVEIYVDGDVEDAASYPEDGTIPDLGSRAEEMPGIQYVGIAGPVGVYGTKWENPALAYGRMPETGGEMAYTGVGDVTTYEWRIRVYNSYPNGQTDLKPGTKLGFDVAVIDKDHSEEKPTWKSWGPTWRRFKGVDPERLGTLILGDRE